MARTWSPPPSIRVVYSYIHWDPPSLLAAADKEPNCCVLAACVRLLGNQPVECALPPHGIFPPPWAAAGWRTWGRVGACVCVCVWVCFHQTDLNSGYYPLDFSTLDFAQLMATMKTRWAYASLWPQTFVRTYSLALEKRVCVCVCVGILCDFWGVCPSVNSTYEDLGQTTGHMYCILLFWSICVWCAVWQTCH